MPRRTPLSRDRVLAAALDLVDEEGVEALSMRRLGRELGVEAMSLYGYVASKEDLIEGVVEQVFQEMPLVVPSPGDWQARVRAHAAIYRKVLLDHPNVVRLMAGRPLESEGIAEFVDSALALLRSTGLDLHTAYRVLNVIASFTQGMVLEQVGSRRGKISRRAEHPPLDRERFPHLAAALTMYPTDYDRDFELGIDVIVAAIERMIADAPPPPADERDATGFRKIIG
jgi:AcrR family transcriptional regulator